MAEFKSKSKPASPGSLVTGFLAPPHPSIFGIIGHGQHLFEVKSVPKAGWMEDPHPTVQIRCIVCDETLVVHVDWTMVRATKKDLVALVLYMKGQAERLTKAQKEVSEWAKVLGI